MKISTTRFGEIEVAPEEIVEFSEGLLGFEDAHRFVILNTQDGGPFRWLQCLDQGDLAFVIIEPLQFMYAYDLEISDADVEFLGVKAVEDLVLYAIVTIPDNPRDMTANLQGPLVINVKTRRGRQIISNNPAHSLKTSILAAMEDRARRLAAAAQPPADAPASTDSPKKEGQG